MDKHEHQQNFDSGRASASIVAAGFGLACFGIFVVLSEKYGSIAKEFSLYPPTGPLSGKVAAGVLAWAGSWLLLNFIWKDKQRDVSNALWFSVVLTFLGLLLTFPAVSDAICGR